DMGVFQPCRPHRGFGIGQRFGVVCHGEVDYPLCAHRGQPCRVAVFEPAGCGDAVRQTQEIANGGGVAHACPCTLAALSFMISGMTSSRKPTSAAAAIHLSGWISGKSVPNSILCLSWVFAYWITCLGKYFGLQPERSMNTLVLCKAIERLSSTH